MQRFSDKTVLITGAASGIGKATAERLGSEGANIYGLDIDPEKLQQSLTELNAAGINAQGQCCDVSNPEQIDAAIAGCIEAFGTLDVLVNVAGILRMEATEHSTTENWQRTLDINLTGTYLMCRSALPHLLANRGNIINISSTSALAGLPWSVAYAASKGGVLALTNSMAVEFGKRGVRSNAICPGSIITNMHTGNSLPENADLSLLPRVSPLDEARGPEYVAGLIATVASEQDGAHINGSHFKVDGGTLA